MSTIASHEENTTISPNRTGTVGALVLAAGFSRRFGAIKLQAKLASGQTVFAQTLARIAAATPHIVVVTREQLIQVRQDIFQQSDRHITTLLCPDSDRGMGHTLAYGFRHIPDDWDGCLVCLGDMPFVTTQTYQTLLAELHSDLIIQPAFEDQIGNPIGFGSQFFAVLRRVTGDTGGRDVVKTNRDAIRRVSINDPAILQDIDTPADLARLDGADDR